MGRFIESVLETMGNYLTENNAHYARSIMDYSAGYGASPYTDEEMGLAYRVGVEILAEVTRARREGVAPNFTIPIHYLQDYAATIGATPPNA